MAGNLKLLALADDLTGALEVGAAFAARGARSLVTTELTLNPSGITPRTSVLAIDTDSRHLPAPRAQERVRRLARRALALDVPLLYKKTDSTLRGNIGAELWALMQVFAGEPLVYIPAFPAMRRTCKHGLLYVDGIPLHKTPFAADPLEPVTGSAVAAVLSPHCPAPTVCVGQPDRLLDAMRQPTPPPVLICDGETDDDLRRTAQAFLESGAFKLAAGPGAFAAAIAGTLRFPSAGRAGMPVAKRSLTVCGSLNPVSLEQVRRAASAGIPVVIASPEELMPAPSSHAPARRDLLQRLVKETQKNPHVILQTARSEKEVARCLSRAEGLGISGPRAHLHVARQVGRVVKAAVRRLDLDALVIFGGDTARSVLRALNDPVIEPVAEVAPGIPRCLLHTRAGDLQLVTKAGGFGPPDLFLTVLRALSTGPQ